MHPELQSLLRQRLAVIADHALRDHDPAAHLTALMQASHAITAWQDAHRDEIDAKLRHFLSNASYEKALAHLAAAEH